MKAMSLWVAVLLGMGICWIASEGGAEEITFLLPNGLYVTKTVVSLREARFNHLVPQRYDLSCGAASLATILNYYYGVPVDEQEIIKDMLARGDQEQIAKKGFSLLDLKRYAEAHEYLANGYRVPVENLKKLTIPSIILLTAGRYTHFVVLKGIQGDRVYIADPAFGNRSMSWEDFAKDWNGVAFLVVSRDQGKGTFELPLESTLPAPAMSVITIKEMGIGIFSFFQRLPKEF